MPIQDLDDRVNILLVDDQPAKLLSYEVILSELGENLIKANSAREALELLLKTEVAVILLDVSMPELDGFELATMIREHPRFQKTAIIFVSAIQITELDSLRGYEAGAVDYVPVPVVPEVLRAKVRIFAELYRKTRQLERLNAELEQRVAERTAALEASAARLQESERRRNLAMAAGRMGSWEWDFATDRYIWDEGQYRIFGVDPASFVPTEAAVDALIHPEDLDAVREAARNAAATGEYYDREFRICRPDGSLRWCLASGAATLDERGRPIRLSGILHDITERKRAEQALQLLNEELEHRIEERTREREMALAQLFEAQKIDTIGQLTGGVAHDFNNLLMAVLGSLELLKKRIPAEDARSHRLLDNAVQGAERGAALTQRLLAFARRQELKPETVDVAKLIGGMEDLLARALGPAVMLGKHLPKDLAPVRVDANQLELAILNLAVNARDAMPLGGSLSILGREERIPSEDATAPRELPPGPYVRLEVVDTGLGMDEATLARATEPFFTTKGPGKGTGLGLSMVQGLAVQSGGAMTVRSEPGKGTTIALWLPQAERAEAKAEAPELGAAAALDGTPDAGPELTVLVVDDDMLVAAGTAAMLEDLGHRVIEANSGSHALDALRRHEHAIDVVITDHAMPGMTGLELVQRIRASYPSLPVILASGYAEIEDAAEYGALPRLAKPFRQAELAAAIAVASGRAAGRDGNIVPFQLPA
ncbi:response regulator [Enterovirga aerilata]|uniref:response regulator n=1 Tax=Enterovirga aerilata TaxID=2730920 RepID=UPI003211CCCB